MAYQHAADDAGSRLALPAIRHIELADLRDALAKGFADFWAMPSHLLFLGMIYPVIGVLLMYTSFDYEVLPLLFPIAAGFALVGPVAAMGLYELSRRRERGMETEWKHAFGVLSSPAIYSIAALGIVLMAIFILWLNTAQALYISAFGYGSPTMTEFAQQIFTTDSGWWLIVVGNFIGFLYAVVVLTISVVSFPMMIDRHVGPVVAVLTSVRAVARNPFVMAVWGLIVAAMLAIGSLPLLIGLAIVMPVLGHATWHLYRKLVAR